MSTIPIGLMLRSAGHQAAHDALTLATGAAAIGRPAVIFATHGGLALFRPEAPLLDEPRERLLEDRGVAGIGTLLDAARELGVRLIACDAGLRAEALDAAALGPGIEVAGVVTFLEAVGPGQILPL
ncbi:hypothetical protein [Muricoccus radiodurans]|uniref:hypothetical protein n=1 Tax=Muricoccus radiodurans TaxID=2231721 RepID=UPI003CEC84DC